MTSTDTSSFFGSHQARDVPRDQWGRYKLPGPDGEDQSWTRATTFAAVLAESYALQIWKQRQVVWGLARRPDLITMASTIAGPEDKQALGEIVKEAHIAAGTDAKANRGTAIHRACQAAERGAWELVPEELRPHVQAYAQALKAGGLEMLPEYVERTVIVTQYQVAGTFDNLVRCPDGKIRVLDKKTGNLDYADIEFAVQLALYAHADAMFDYSSGRYERLPAIATDYAIIARIDPETGATELHRVNIEWGWVWARTAAEVMDIRKTKHVITPYVPPVTDRMDMQSAANDADTVDRMQAFGATEQEISAFIDRPLPPPPPVIAEAAQIMHQVNANAALTGPDGLTEEQRYRQWAQNTAPNSYVTRTGAELQASINPGMTPPNTVPGGYVDTTSSVPAEFQAFWSDDRHFTEDEEPAAQVNGVPLAAYGQSSQWPCARNEPCEFTADTGLHADGTVCLYGNARPGPIPSSAALEVPPPGVPLIIPASPTPPNLSMLAQVARAKYGDTAQISASRSHDGTITVVVDPSSISPPTIAEMVAEEIPVPDGVLPDQAEVPPAEAPFVATMESGADTMPTAGVPDDAMVAKIGKLSKEAGQLVARRLMERLNIPEDGPGSIKLKQYKIAVARDIVTLAFRHGASIPGVDDDKPDFGVPTGPAPDGDQPASTTKAAAKEQAQAVAAQQRADEVTREAQVKTAVESIRMQGTIEGLQERHTYYSGTSLGWTDEMQTAARTRAAELEQAAGETPLTPMEMIEGATSKETLAKAYAKATNDGQDRSGWTPELNAAAQAKHEELFRRDSVAVSGS